MEIQACFSAEVLKIDAARETEAIQRTIREIVCQQFRRKGAVVGLSGGIDSSVTAALCAGAFGRERVLGIMMPESDSAAESVQLGRLVADSLGIDATVETITPILSAAGCYQRRDAAIRQLIPEYGPDWKSKIVLPNMLDRDAYPVYSVVAQSPTGRELRVRLTADAYLGVVAATNFKQRVRKMLEYYHADRLQYAVSSPSTSESLNKFAAGRQRRIPTPCNSRRRSFTSPCRSQRWTSASMAGTMKFPRKRLARRSDSPPSR